MDGKIFTVYLKVLFVQMALVRIFCFIGLALLCCLSKALSQAFPDSITIVPGEQYKASSIKSFFLGKHYRAEWTTPVKVKVATLDTLAGGLTPFLKGGGRQTKNLRLRDKNGKQYVLRSVDKTYTGALPDIMKGTFVEKLANDQVSTEHPFAAITIPPIISTTGIYHTKPKIYYIPKHAALDSFNNEFGDDLYLFEERPDEDQSSTPNFGFSEDVIGTDNLLEKLFENNTHRVDQKAYARARLFDMFIGDWGRHEDQWRWASFKQGDSVIYRPIPRDRDQTFTLFDGLLIRIGTSAANLNHMQSFDHTIKDIEGYNFPARNLDRQLANELTSNDWVSIASQLQQTISDDIIETGVRQLPPELFSLNGEEIISKLKSRRDSLQHFARVYYNFLAEEVEFVGSPAKEYFIITRQPGKTIVDVHRTSADVIQKHPYYSRQFLTGETEEIRIYTQGGTDVINLVANSENTTVIRIIGSDDKEVFNNNGADYKNIIYYNSHRVDAPGIKQKITNDSIFLKYNYAGFTYDEKGVKKIISYNHDDRIHVGIGYHTKNYKWGKRPFGSEHLIAAKYSISQGGFNFIYEGRLNQAVGKWDLLMNAGFDWVRWFNYFGTGNETKLIRYDIDFYRLRSRFFEAHIGLNRNIDSLHSFGFGLFYNGFKPIIDEDRFVYTHLNGAAQMIYHNKHFYGAQLNYAIQKLDHAVVPRRGIDLSAGISHTINYNQTDSQFTRYRADVNFFLPIFKPVVLSIKLGGAHIDGNPEIYQLNTIGGARNLRGHYRDRFQGNTTFYNANELQFLIKTRSFLYNGTTGLLALYDIGRVWQPGETSGTWHRAYGAGIMIAPFNMLNITFTYSVSREDNQFHLRLGKKL